MVEQLELFVTYYDKSTLTLKEAPYYGRNLHGELLYRQENGMVVAKYYLNDYTSIFKRIQEVKDE